MKIQINIKDEYIDDLIAGAFEYGSNYWIDHIDVGTSGCKYPNGLYQMSNTGYITVFDSEEDKKYTLNNSKIKKGLQIMAEKYPQHFNDILTENDDATTSDVLLQCALFGEIIYG